MTEDSGFDFSSQAASLEYYLAPVVPKDSLGAPVVENGPESLELQLDFWKVE